MNCLLLNRVREGFCEVFVREIWDDMIGGAEVDLLCEAFMRALAADGLMIDD
jgi:hypothetical protein